MIYQLTKDEWGDTYIICVAKQPTPTQVAKRAGVSPGSYASILVQDLYESVFELSLDLKEDYLTYFSLEYKSFAEYLRRRVRLPRRHVDRLADELSHSFRIVYFQASQCFMNDQLGRGILQALFEPGDSNAD